MKSWSAGGLVLFVSWTLALATVGLPAALHAEATAERPQYADGDRWVYSRNGEREEQEFVKYESGSYVIKRKLRDRTVFRVYSSEGNMTKEVDEGGRVLREYVKELPHFRFPLRVGKKWYETYYSGAIRRTVRAEVTAYETITVPAGKFWAFKLEVINQRTDRERPAYETLWYTPEVKRLVKYQSREFQTDLELVEYHVTNVK